MIWFNSCAQVEHMRIKLPIMENGYIKKEQLCTYKKNGAATMGNFHVIRKFSTYNSFSGRFTCYFFDSALKKDKTI